MTRSNQEKVSSNFSCYGRRNRCCPGKIGEELLLQVEAVDRLRGELDKGLRLRTISLCPVLSDAGVPHARVPTPLVD
jgi:hypothetical protein